MYLMRVDEVLPYADYWERVELRVLKNNIYKPIKSGFQQIPNDYHGIPDMESDLYNENALLSGCFIYLGSLAYPIPPAFGDFVRRFQGYNKRSTSDPQVQKFVNWAFSQGTGKFGEPADPRRTKRGCQTGNGEGYPPADQEHA